jgi:hypothetical protein
MVHNATLLARATQIFCSRVHVGSPIGADLGVGDPRVGDNTPGPPPGQPPAGGAPPARPPRLVSHDSEVYLHKYPFLNIIYSKYSIIKSGNAPNSGCVHRGRNL